VGQVGYLQRSIRQTFHIETERNLNIISGFHKFSKVSPATVQLCGS